MINFHFQKNWIFIIVGVLFYEFVNAQSNMKWMNICIKSPTEKEYVINKIKNTNGLQYIAYCNTHQALFIKYDKDIFFKPTNVIQELKNTDTKLQELIIEKVDVDDEKATMELLNTCDFNSIDGENIKNELQK
jgi:hypothetical protein